MTVSIIIPLFNRLEFTRQCLDRVWRNTSDEIAYEVIVVDNGSSDGTSEWFSSPNTFGRPVRYHRNAENLGFAKANNIGARLAKGEYLLFLNNDTLVQPRWLSEMVGVRRSNSAIGAVGIKQLFPYTNTIYHTGIVFTPEGRPEHLYPHLDASLPHVNQQREYQAVMGACFLIDRVLFDECGGFDEAYRNGYEDIDLCMKIRQSGRKIVCCTSAFIYHYGQISDGRTTDDDHNAALFAKRWSRHVKPDRDDYLIRDRAALEPSVRPPRSTPRALSDDCIYLADNLDQGNALTWINAELALALKQRGVPVFVNGGAQISRTLSASVRQGLRPLAIEGTPIGGVQLKWSHYWPRHLNLDLAGDINLELFVINYLFGTPGNEPWDFWLQCLRQNHYGKLALSEFCHAVLQQIGVPELDCQIWHPGYSREIADVEAPRRLSARFRFLTVTNSHDLQRYNTLAVIEAFQNVFSRHDDVALVIKDYGASSGDESIRRVLAQRKADASIEYISAFSDKRELIGLYKSCDAFISAHRGEGFGMKILDAMACGLPVITPLFGGPTAYCRPDNCFAVDFSVVPMGDCLDTRSLHITNQPMWAEVDLESLGQQMRRLYESRPYAKELGSSAQAEVLERFSWDNAAARLVEITTQLRALRPKPVRPQTSVAPPQIDSSPYWLGLRISVVVPTHNRKEKLLACLEALSRQTVLPQEFEVLVVDDGSTDGTKEAVIDHRFPFTMRYFWQDGAGPGAARNLGIAQAAGELVLFIGDDILADDGLLEEHLLAHATRSEPGTAVLGHIDWPESPTPNAVMQCVCGDAKLQFAYSDIPKLPVLDHRFFYTSNISLKRQFLVYAADSGICFDPCFRRAAFEDSEFAYRLIPRGLRIHYAPKARATHDHWMDLESFAGREFGAGEMAVVFYRKHPGLDEYLRVRWIADFVEPADALHERPDFLRHLEAFDRQTDTLLRAFAGTLEELMALNRRPGSASAMSLSADTLRAALNNVLRVVFDVQRTRGKLQEWFSMVEAPSKVQTAQTLASVMRKIEFLGGEHPVALPTLVAPFDFGVVSGLSERLAQIPGLPAAGNVPHSARQRIGRRVRRLISIPPILSRLVAADRFIEARLLSMTRPSWLAKYRRFRSGVRRSLL